MPSRRGLIEMDEAERTEFLKTQQTLIIVSNGQGGYPHPMPMWYCVDEEGSLYCTTFSKSQKVLNWRRDPKASLLVEDGTEYNQLRGVVVYARTAVIEDQDVVVDTLVNINTKGRDLNSTQRENLRQQVARTASKRVVLKFTPERYVTWDHQKLGGRY